MTQHKFIYQDNKSSKFWHITLEDSSHTVTYGKIGTKGRTQSKSFETGAEAKKSYEKLIQQKLKKGYTEVTTDNNKVEEEKAKDTSTKIKKAVSAKTKTTPVEQTVAIPKKLEITRSIDLNPEDWHWATWRSRAPLSKPQIQSFDIEKAKKQLEKIKKPKSKYNTYYHIYQQANNWKKAKINNFISKRESLFWLNILTFDANKDNQENYDKLINNFSNSDYKLSIEIQEVINLLILKIPIGSTHIPSSLSSFIYALFPFIDFTITLIELTEDTKEYSSQDRDMVTILLSILIKGFEQHIWHYLDDSEITSMRQKLREFMQNNNVDSYKILYYLASYLGMHDEILHFLDKETNFSHYQYRYLTRDRLYAGLGSADLVESQMRRFNFFPWCDPVQVRLCLATTEYSALDLIRNGILHQNATKDDVTKLLKTFALVKAPEAAPYMLELWLSSKVPSLARQWLNDNPIHSIVGLIPVAAGELPKPPIKAKPNELSRAAIDFLISLKRKGYEDLIRQAIAEQPAEIAAVITQEVLEVEELNYETVDEQSTPQWLQQGVQEIKRSHQTYKSTNWVTPADLPPLLISKKCFNERQVNAVLTALGKSTLDSPYPILKDLKNKCDRASVDNFIWSLFQRWLTDGAPKKENWAMLALGLLGGDEIAIKFTPYLRKWPGESQHHRAVLGLQCLRIIGSDTALMQINGIARKKVF